MKNIGIVSHDAGGAEVLSHLVANDKSNSFVYCLEGPAKSIFKKNLGVDNTTNIHEMLTKCDWLLCSTSWQSDLEKLAIKAFKENRKKTVAILDHWVNYKERFVLNDSYLLPDEIWTTDKYASHLAKEHFNDTEVKEVNNYYLEHIKNEIESLGSSKEVEGVALYVCEPIKEHAFLQYGDERYWGYTEEDALEFCLKNIRSMPKNIERLIIRPHPSEKLEKYNWVQDIYDVEILFGGHKTLQEEISSASLVIGCESMAMIVALTAGKLTISSIPPGGRPCVLPHKEILSLQNIIKGNL